MSRSYFKWLIIYEDGTSEMIISDTAASAIFSLSGDEEAIHSIIRFDLI